MTAAEQLAAALELLKRLAIEKLDPNQKVSVEEIIDVIQGRVRP